MRSNRLVLDSEHTTQATNTPTTTNYANIAEDLLLYNMASATLTAESNSTRP